jgi:hypothetical protein
LFAEDAFAEGVEFEFGEEAFEFGLVGGADGEFVPVGFEGDGAIDRGEFAGEAGLVGELFDVLLLFALELVGGGEEGVEGAEFGEEFFGERFGVAPRGCEAEQIFERLTIMEAIATASEQSCAQAFPVARAVAHSA